MAAILPGSTIGILGGGQLGRMIALAARSMGYNSACLDPNPRCAARPVVDKFINAPWEEVAAFTELSGACDVVTLEIEKIPFASLSAASQRAPLRPRSGVLHVVQDRIRQKDWLAAGKFPLGPYRIAHSPAELAETVHALGGKCYAKANSGGYDGRGQVLIQEESALSYAWEALGSKGCVVEKALPLEREISVLVARLGDGSAVTYPIAHNHHENGILVWSVIPANISPALAAQATGLARRVTEALGVVGLLAVEMFVTNEGVLLVNELAPRPHNSFHETERGCATSQFEQLVRAICDLPLGSADLQQPAAIANILGEAWLSPQPPNFSRALTVPTARLHLYQKHTPRPGRKMGHFSVTGATAEEALQRAQEAVVMLAR